MTFCQCCENLEPVVAAHDQPSGMSHNKARLRQTLPPLPLSTAADHAALQREADGAGSVRTINHPGVLRMAADDHMHASSCHAMSAVGELHPSAVRFQSAIIDRLRLLMALS